jgi:YgiT-type zinc finger domain-containing protein
VEEGFSESKIKSSDLTGRFAKTCQVIMVKYMICLICRQAEIVDGFTSIPFEREEFRLLINHVPAHICPSCGEAIVDEDVAFQLISKAEDSFEQGVREDVCDY